MVIAIVRILAFQGFFCEGLLMYLTINIMKALEVNTGCDTNAYFTISIVTSLMEFVSSFMDIFSLMNDHNIQRPLSESEISLGVLCYLEEDQPYAA